MANSCIVMLIKERWHRLFFQNCTRMLKLSLMKREHPLHILIYQIEIQLKEIVVRVVKYPKMLI